MENENEKNKKYKIVRTTYPMNYTGLPAIFSYQMEKNYIEKTNLVKLARINRKVAAEAKYHLYDNFRKKTLSSDTVYAVHDLNHLRHLKFLFEESNNGFFFRNNLWILIPNYKNKMSKNDWNEFDNEEITRYICEKITLEETDFLSDKTKDQFILYP